MIFFFVLKCVSFPPRHSRLLISFFSFLSHRRNLCHATYFFFFFFLTFKFKFKFILFLFTCRPQNGYVVNFAFVTENPPPFFLIVIKVTKHSKAWVKNFF